MSQWIRPLSQLTPAAALWHAPLVRSYSTTTNCGTVVEGSIEVASDEKAERDGRCRACVKDLVRRAGPAAKPAAKKKASPVPSRATKAAATKAATAARRSASARKAADSRAANAARRSAVAKRAARTRSSQSSSKSGRSR